MTTDIGRRDFLRATAATGAGLTVFPSLLAQAANGSSNPLNVALIGAGVQGEALLTACLKMGDDSGIRFKAVCDIWEDLNLQRIVRLLGRYGHEAAGYADYRAMLDTEKKLDAVLIATPDFVHAEQTIACLKAGLHVYCEAPMAHTIEDARRMVQAARDSGKLLQIGRQRRSNPRYRHCQRQLLETADILGRITAVNAQWHLASRSDRGWSRRRVIEPETLEKYGYASMHQFKNWMWYKGFGAGPVVTLGVHQIDVINWFLGTTPRSITARGGTYYLDKKTHDQYDTVMAILEYETNEGIICASYETVCTNGYGGHMEVFMGDRGTLELSESSSRGGVYRDPEAPDWGKWVRLDILRAPGEVKKEVSSSTIDVAETKPPAKYDIPVVLTDPNHQPHLRNFFDTIGGRAELTCSAEVAYPATVTALKINEAVEKGQTLELTPEMFKA